MLRLLKSTYLSHIFKVPDYLLIIKLYFSYFSNLQGTIEHINQHKPQEAAYL